MASTQAGDVDLKKKAADEMQPHLIGKKGGQKAYSIWQLAKFVNLHPGLVRIIDCVCL